MGIYSKKVEDEIGKIYDDLNVLQKYDNYTYHIRFFMIPSEIQKEVDKYENYKEIEDLINKHKIIIAESGVTSSVNISSLTIHSTCPGGILISNALLFEMTIEDMTYELINKIAVASKLFGYENHIVHPYYLEIWFDGYENVTENKFSQGLPKENIQQFRHLYKVIITENKTEQESDKMKWKMKMSWSPYRASCTDFSLIYDIPDITIEENTNFINFCEDLKEKINDVYKAEYINNMGENNYKNLFPDDNIFEFVYVSYDKKYDPLKKWDKSKGVANLYSDEYKETLNKNNISFKPENIDLDKYNIGVNSVAQNYSKKENKQEEYRSVVFKPETSYTQDDVINKYIDVNSITKASFNNKIIVKRKPTQKLSQFLLDMWEKTFSNDKSVSIFLYPTMKYVGESNKQSYYKIRMYICFYVCPGLEDAKNAMGRNTYFDINEIEQMQLNYLDEMFYNQKYRRIKRYYVGSTGKNINVLKYKDSEDYMWFLNNGISSLNDAMKDKISVVESTPEEKERIEYSQNKINSEINKIKNKILNINSKSDEIYYIDDIYLRLDEFEKELCLNSRDVGIIKDDRVKNYNDTSSKPPEDKNENGNSEEKIDDDKHYLSAKLGYNGLFGVSQRKKLDIDIIGDPYWLSIGDEEFITKLDAVSSLINPHIIISTNWINPVDKDYEYSSNKHMQFNTPFRVLQIESYFNEGKFTQKLLGCIALPFIQSSKKVIDDYFLLAYEDDELKMSFPNKEAAKREKMVRNAENEKIQKAEEARKNAEYAKKGLDIFKEIEQKNKVSKPQTDYMKDLIDSQKPQYSPIPKVSYKE